MKSELTPDGVRYLHIGQGERVARPFHFRWLIPTICRTDKTRWRAVQAVSLLGMLPAAWWYAGTGWRGVFAAVFVIGLAGVWTFNWRWPVLVDAPAILLALLAATCAQHGWWVAAIPLVLLAGCTKETAPVFAALWAWSPLLLAGLVAPTLRACFHAGDDVLDHDNALILAHPFRAGWEWHRRLPAAVWVLPWGVGVIALVAMSWQLAAVLVVAYAQCCVATDTVRLYQWAWPVVAVSAAAAVPSRWWLPLAVLGLVNPFRGDGL